MVEQKINILFVLPNFDTGGSEKLVIDIIKNLDKEKFNPVLAVFFTGNYEKEFLKLGYPFYVIHRDKISSKLSTFFFLKNIVQKHHIHVVNTHHTSPLIQGLLPFKIFSQTALIHTEHSRLADDKRIHAKAIFLEKLFLKKVDVALGISKGVCDFYIHELGVSKNKVRMIRNGIDIQRFDLKGFDAVKYREKLGFKKEECLIGMFGNFRVEKNQKNLVEAMKFIKNKENVRLVLCGSGPTEKDIKALIKQLNLSDYVSLLGMRLDIPELMNILDIYCLPSFFEGLPLSLLEAMSAKKPVVATNVTGNNEVIEHQKTGILVQPNSPESLAVALDELIADKNLRLELGEKGYQHCVKEFSFQKMMMAYEELFEEVVTKQ